jgi:hypothetical protein
MFGFQKLDVYRCAVTFLGVASTLAERVPRGHSALSDQLRRAALSVPLNIAEGSGKGTMEDREARRSMPSHAGRPWNAPPSSMPCRPWASCATTKQTDPTSFSDAWSRCSREWLAWGNDRRETTVVGAWLCAANSTRLTSSVCLPTPAG